MGYVIEITESKFDELSENVEKMLRYGGKVMSCIDRMRRERMGERMPMPDYRDDWRNEREERDWRDSERYGERRYDGRGGRGRY